MPAATGSLRRTAMNAMPSKRDYSLIGRDAEARGRERAGGRRVVPHRHSAQADEGADAAHRRPGDPRHAHLARPAGRSSAPAASGSGARWWCVPFFFAYGVLYGSSTRLALARMRPRHRLQDALDERRGLPDRLLHDHAQPGDLALEPYAPPHRHDHRRPRSGDRRHAAAGPAARRARTSSASSMPGTR